MTHTWQQQQQIEREFVKRTRREWAQALVDEHKSVAAAARAGGIDRTSFFRIIKQSDVKTQVSEKDAMAREREDRARALAAKGYTLKQAAESLGMTISGVIRMEYRIGVEFRRESRAGQHKPKAPPVPDRPMTMADYARMESERMRINNRGGL